MNAWIKLINEKPVKRGIYKVLCYSQYGTMWEEEYLLWCGDDGFQPLDIKTNREAYPINMNVTHWFKIDEIKVPVDEAKKLVVKTEVFFHQDGLNEFAIKHNIEKFGRYGNANEYIISTVPLAVQMEMRKLFKSNGTHTNVRNKS